MKTAEDIFIEKHFPNVGVNEETKSWFNSLDNSDKIIEAMKEYAKSVAQQTLENAFDLIPKDFYLTEEQWEVIKGVLDKNNIPLTI